MRAGDITRRSEIVAAIVLLLFLVLVGAAVNVPIAVMLMNAPTPFQGGPEVDLSGAAAPAHWPSPTPTAEPWPAPNLWQEWWAPGIRRIVVRSVVPPDTYSMDIQHFGWPAPVIETNETQRVREGPRSPVWREGAPPRLIGFGLIVNPVLYGVALWCVLVLPVLLLVMGRRAWRLRGGRCAWCGFGLEGLYRCPECGREARRRRTA